VSDLERISPERILGRGAPPADPVLDDLRAAWEGIVGDAAARNSRPVRVGPSGLVVACRSAAWAGELGMMRTTIEAAASTLAGGPMPVRFEVGGMPTDASL
jgi:hypothetical protein